MVGVPPTGLSARPSDSGRSGEGGVGAQFSPCSVAEEQQVEERGYGSADPDGGSEPFVR